VSDLIGIYGKLPAHGDFVDRHLPNDFIAPWDRWLQLSLTASKARLGASWIDHYLTAPVWRFALTSRCVNKQNWLGILLPSVDSVGRYFPLTFALPLPATSALPETLLNNDEWFKRLETIALACLHEQPDIGAIMEVINSKDMPEVKTFVHTADGQQQTSESIQAACKIYQQGSATDHSRHHIQDTLTQKVLNRVLGKKNEAVSLWQSKRSEQEKSPFFYTEGLPDNEQFIAMLSGFTVKS
jgi:type VI secretion system protein ImpM